uniref:Glutaredoxin domain-containing protein n=1 Tax=viral metagenome TaxID=1070528 RepID=A0A6C0LLH3_9ZZZZ
MSCILYYSNYCQHSKHLLENLSKHNVSQKDIHFVCIDRREKDSNGKTFVVLDNGQKIIMPENVTRVPALLLLNQGYNVLYGEAITNYLKPKQVANVKKATQNNMEPLAFAFDGGLGNVVSDSYSFLDQRPEDLEAKGNGGMRQMHSYVDLNYNSLIETPNDDTDYKKTNKISEDLTVEKLQQQRNSELQQLQGPRQPVI